MPDTTRKKIQDGTIVVGTDTFKIALFLSTSNLTTASTTYAGLTNEVANAFGYTTGGISVTMAITGTTTTTVTTATSMVWTASGGSITAKWAVVYEVGGSILCFCLLESGGADVTATDGNTLTITMNASGTYTLA
jgi:hypothetical protein